MQRWEYCVHKFSPTGWVGGKVDAASLERSLNDLGAQGWEVTGVIETNQYEGATRHVVVLLKRPVSAP